jgi:hypothetical protein
MSWSIGGGVGSVDATGVYSAPDSGNGEVTVTARTGGLADSATVQLVNELAADVPPAQSVIANTPLAFSTPIAITDGDPQSIDVPAALTLSATHGTLSLSQSPGLTFTAGTGAGDKSMTVTGDLADLNDGLSGLTFTPRQDYQGIGVVTITLDETGTHVSPQYTIPITVQSPAPAPAPAPTPAPSPNTPQPPRGLTPVAPSGDALPTGGGGDGGLGAPADSPAGDTGNFGSSGSSNAQAAAAASNSGGAPAVTPGVIIAPPTGGGALSTENNAPASLVQRQVALTVDILGAGEKSQTLASPIASSSAQHQAPMISTVVVPAEQPSDSDSGSAALADVLDARVETVPDQVFSFLSPGSRMSREMNDLDDQTVSRPLKMGKIVVGSATCVSMGASAAYFIWLMRGGSLLSSMLSTFPTWNSIDPLPVLDNFESRKRRKARIASDGESLESLIDNQAAPTPTSLAAPASSSRAGEEDA